MIKVRLREGRLSAISLLFLEILTHLLGIKVVLLSVESSVFWAFPDKVKLRQAIGTLWHHLSVILDSVGVLLFLKSQS